jgi:hypothetical protein
MNDTDSRIPMPGPDRSYDRSYDRASDRGQDRGDEPIGAPLRDVLDLFASQLADVRFPDVDATTLRGAADVVEAAHADVRGLEAALDEARRRLEETQDALLHKAQRAVAYARVFADGDGALTARLDAVALPRARATRGATAPTAPPEAPRRRRRTSATSDTLFAAPVEENADEARVAP